jgi:hypothetical protein
VDAVDAACARIAARLAAGLTPRPLSLWWKDGVQAYWCDRYHSVRKDNLVTHLQCTHPARREFARVYWASAMLPTNA